MKKIILVGGLSLFFLALAVSASPQVSAGKLFPNGIFGSDGLFPNGVFGNRVIKDLPKTFNATLRGNKEVPPVTSSASGRLRIKVASSSANYNLRVNDINEMTMAHLHCGTQGENGPVVAFLFGPNTGVSAERFVFSSNLSNASIVANTCSPAITNLAELKAAIKEGRIYVNVHTVTNPNGEIRGQLK